jgi:hypothetical protein
VHVHGLGLALWVQVGRQRRVQQSEGQATTRVCGGRWPVLLDAPREGVATTPAHHTPTALTIS